MNDLERTLTRHLHEQAAAVEPRPDLDAVVSGLERARRPDPEGRRTRVLLLAAAVVLIASISAAVTLLIVGDDHLRTQSRITTPPANGVILVPNVEGLRQFDPTGQSRRIALPTTAQSSPRAPVFAPDGRHIAYATDRHVVVTDLDTATTRTIGTCDSSSNNCSIAWSHDGSTIAVAAGTGITLLQPDGPPSQTGQVIATTGGVPTDVSWTPDDQQLIYAVRTDGTAIKTINRDGTGAATLVAPGHNLFQHISPALSPDGSTLAWIDLETRPDPTFDVALVTMNLADPATTTRLPLGVCMCNNSPGLTWSPDGTMLAVITPQFRVAAPPATRQLAGYFELYLVTTDGSRLTRTHVLGTGTPTWQPIP